MVKKRSYTEDTKMFEVLTLYSRKCKCGHTIVMRPSTEKVLCNWCKQYVFKDKKTEDLYRLKEKIK